MEEGAGTRFAVQYVLWKAHVGCVSRVHYQLEETGFVSCRKKSLTVGQISSLHSTVMAFFLVPEETQQLGDFWNFVYRKEKPTRFWLPEPEA